LAEAVQLLEQAVATDEEIARPALGEDRALLEEVRCYLAGSSEE
jgi:hypothetical protein